MSTAVQIDSRWGVLSDQLIRWCCIDRLSWQKLIRIWDRARICRCVILRLIEVDGTRCQLCSGASDGSVRDLAETTDVPGKDGAPFNKRIVASNGAPSLQLRCTDQSDINLNPCAEDLECTDCLSDHRCFGRRTKASLAGHTPHHLQNF